MQDWYNDVLKFHEKYGCYIGTNPGWQNDSIRNLRWSLISEEMIELTEAWENRDLPESLDAIADLVYVLVGAAIALGVDLRPIWDEVQRTNLNKIGGTTREDGKIMKPKDWQAPEIKAILISQGYLDNETGQPQ